MKKYIHSNDKSLPQVTVPPTSQSQSKDENNNSNVELINRLVIEDDVLPVLPSVKKLASAFASKQETTTDNNLAPIQRPKVSGSYKN